MIMHPKTKTLIRYSDGDLPGAMAKKIAAHLDQCTRCKKRYAILQRVDAVNAPKKDLPSNFTQHIVDNLKDVRWSNEPICAEVKTVIGHARVYRKGCDEGVEAFPGIGLKKGDTIRLLGDSRALIELNDGSSIYLNKDTEISLPSARYNIAMIVGEIFAMMKPQKKPFEICTPSAILAVIGTDFDAKVTENKKTLLQVLKGKVSFKNESGGTVVKKKRQVEAAKDAKPIPQKIKDARTVYQWTIPMKPTGSERGWITKKLYLLIAGILAVGILIGGYSLYQEYFAYEPAYEYQTSKEPSSSASPGEASSVGQGQKPSNIRQLELASPYTQKGSSWRAHVHGQVQKENSWIDLYQMVSRSDIIDVDEQNGSRVLVTIEDVKVPEGPEKQIADKMIGRRFAYLVSPDGKAHSFSIADGGSLEFGEIEFYGRMLTGSNISGIFLKKQPLIPGDQWSEEFADTVPGYPNSYIRGTGSYQFERYEFRDGAECAIIRSHTMGSVGGELPYAKFVEPKVTRYFQLNHVNFEQAWEYSVDVKSGRVVSGTFTSRSSGIKGTATSVIQGRRVPVTEVIEQESGDTARTFFTVEYLQ